MENINKNTENTYPISFWQLFDKFQKIEIPIIQRDFAQGRSDKKIEKIRSSFLDSLIKALESDGESLELDFVYGHIEKEKKIFQPIDGQQRLTTLFLLHWYIASKTMLSADSKKHLGKFTYETRVSSREFCNELVKNGENLGEDETICEKIADSDWFFLAWKKDPTIKAMLVMLKSIEKKLREKDNEELKKFWEKLISENSPITFIFTGLSDIGLTDDLYIKMNARGKELTNFENFKAKFEKHLSQIDEKKKDEFSKKIDNEWTDFFWKYGKNDKSYLIDKFFMNYFNYITEMRHYYKIFKKTLKTEDIDFEQIEKIYDSKENINFLFQTLDRLSIIRDSFEKLFSKNEDEYEENKVCLFDKDINLLEKVIKGEDPNIQQKILLFIIINHLINNDDINDNLKDLLRISRNLTYRMRGLKTGEISYTTSLAFENISSLLNMFLPLINKNVYDELASNQFEISNSGITKKSLQFEVDKAKIIIKNEKKIKQEIFRLEDFKYIKGDVRNFLSSEISELKFYNNAIREIFSKDDSSIIRSMLTVIDYFLQIGWSNLGERYFSGKKNNWEVILTNEYKENKADFFKKYFESYKSNNHSLEKIIESYLNKSPQRGWIYYFIKYPEMTSKMSHVSKDENIYAWKDDFSLEKMGGSNLNAYHLNPYIYTVEKKTGAEPEAKQHRESSYLKCNDLIIYSKKESWKIQNFDKEKFKDLITKYNLDIKDDKETKKYFCLLKETDKKDRIEILCDLLNEVKKLT